MNANEFQQIFPLGEKNIAYAQYFIGQSYLQPLVTGNISVVNVTFEPKCRNNWHIHRGGGQVLVCTAGHGWYQQEGKPARKLGPGDVVDIPADVKHWHGASADEWFSHLAISVTSVNVSTDWLEPVSNEAYARIHSEYEG